MACFSTTSFARFRAIVVVWILCLLASEGFLLFTSSVALYEYPYNSLFKPLFIISLISVLGLFGTVGLCVIITRSKSKYIKYFIILIVLSHISLSIGHIYYYYFIRNTLDYLLDQLNLCSNSLVFAEIYWEYKKLYAVCGNSRTERGYFFDGKWTLDFIRQFYTAFHCNGYCDIGIISCSERLGDAIYKVGVLHNTLNLFNLYEFN
jgi:hypothetical protein